MSKRRIEPVKALPQRARDLFDGDGAAVFCQRYLEVRSANVIAGRDGHWGISSIGFARVDRELGRAVIHEAGAEASRWMLFP